MDTIPARVMEYPIPFPSLHAMLERHPEILHLRQQYREKDIQPHANAVSQIVNYMFEQITNFEEPHDYFAKKNDESLWYYIGTFVTAILKSMTNGDSELSTNEQKYELINRAILLSQPGHLLDRIGYDVTNPNGNGGHDNDMLSCAPYNTNGASSKIYDFSSMQCFIVKDDCNCLDTTSLHTRSIVLLEFTSYLADRVDTTYDADPTREWGDSYLTPASVLETDDMIDRRLRREYSSIRWPRRERRRTKYPTVDEYVREHADTKARSAVVHNALIESKLDLIKGMCDFIVGDLPIPTDVVLPKAFCETSTQTEDNESECIAAQPAHEHAYDELDYRGPWDTLSEDSHSVKQFPSEYSAAVVIQSGVRSYLVRQRHAVALATIKLYVKMKLGQPHELTETETETEIESESASNTKTPLARSTSARNYTTPTDVTATDDIVSHADSYGIAASCISSHKFIPKDMLADEVSIGSGMDTASNIDNAPTLQLKEMLHGHDADDTPASVRSDTGILVNGVETSEFLLLNATDDEPRDEPPKSDARYYITSPRGSSAARDEFQSHRYDRPPDHVDPFDMPASAPINPFDTPASTYGNGDDGDGADVPVAAAAAANADTSITNAFDASSADADISNADASSAVDMQFGKYGFVDDGKYHRHVEGKFLDTETRRYEEFEGYENFPRVQTASETADVSRDEPFEDPTPAPSDSEYDGDVATFSADDAAGDDESFDEPPIVSDGGQSDLAPC